MPALVTFDEQAKIDFREWAFKNTAVTWFKYKADDIIWVKLTSSKYTTKENGNKIANSIAHYYRLQTNYKKPVSVTIWTHDNKFWAKGH
ncbi:hypothetical protein HQ585_01940 [candidate division KSB1 bacterium]|nr:hypothetical protein [candidate division KSB1 bacterium]